MSSCLPLTSKVMGVAYDCLLAWRQGNQQPAPEEPSIQVPDEVSATLQTTQLGIGDNNSMEIPFVDEDYFADLMNRTALNFPSNGMQWNQDEYFWV